MPIKTLAESYFSGGSFLSDASNNGLRALLNELITRINLTAADWDSTKCRYYFVDNDAGDDDRDGYIDAAPATIFAAGAGDAVAIKTGERLRELLPRDGRQRRAVVFFKKRADGGNYVNKSGANDYLDVAYSNYDVLIFRASDFTNSAEDRVDMQGVVDAIGPNPDGSWTATGITGSWTVTVAGGILPAENTVTGLKATWKGNVSTAQRTQPNHVCARLSDTQFDVSLTQSLANGDEFFLMTPGVKFTTIVGHPGFNQMDTNSVFGGPLIAGLRFTGNIASSFATPIQLQFCRFDGTVGFVAWNEFIVTSTYRLEDLATTVTIRCGVDARSTFNITNGGTRGTLLQHSAFHSGTVGLVATHNVLPGCYVNGLASLSVGLGARIGSFTGIRPTRIRAGIRINNVSGGFPTLMGASDVVLGTIDLDGSTLGVQINTGAGNVIAEALTGAVAGQPVLDMSNARYTRLLVLAGTTATGSSEVALASGVTKTFASLTADHWADANGNIVHGTGGVTVTRLTAGTMMRAPVLAADPSSPAEGDCWFKNTGGVRTFHAVIGGAIRTLTFT